MLDFSRAQDNGFTKSFVNLATYLKRIKYHGFADMTDEEMRNIAYLSRRGCQVHYQRNVLRVTSQASIVPTKIRASVRESLLQLINLPDRSAFLTVCESLIREVPALRAFIDWYCVAGPRTMIFGPWRHMLQAEHPDVVQLETPLTTNQVEGRNGALKAKLGAKQPFDTAAVALSHDLAGNKTQEELARGTHRFNDM